MNAPIATTPVGGSLTRLVGHRFTTEVKGYGLVIWEIQSEPEYVLDSKIQFVWIKAVGRARKTGRGNRPHSPCRLPPKETVCLLPLPNDKVSSGDEPR